MRNKNQTKARLKSKNFCHSMNAGKGKVKRVTSKESKSRDEAFRIVKEDLNNA